MRKADLGAQRAGRGKAAGKPAGKPGRRSLVRNGSPVFASLMALAVSSCAVSPQLSAASRSLQAAPRDRVRAYEACRAAAADRAGLVECMEAEGYRLAPRGNDPQSRDCWASLDSASGLPRAYCFEKASTEDR